MKTAKGKLILDRGLLLAIQSLEKMAAEKKKTNSQNYTLHYARIFITQFSFLRLTLISVNDFKQKLT